jgi:hypothetical protein
MRVVTLLALVLLAQAVDDGQSRPSTTGQTGVHVDRHIDAHIEPREGTPAASPSEAPSRETPPPPAIGTTAPDPLPPAIQLYRDQFYRDRR